MYIINKRVILAIFSFMLLFGLANASESNCLIKKTQLQTQRLVVVKHYFKLLGSEQYQKIIPLFTKNALVSDPVAHVLKASKYYSELDRYLIDPHLTLYDIYVGLYNPNVIGAHFNMKIKPQDKLINRGEISDLFVFKKDSTKISRIYIMGNKEKLPFNQKPMV